MPLFIKQTDKSTIFSIFVIIKGMISRGQLQLQHIDCDLNTTTFIKISDIEAQLVFSNSKDGK